MRATCMKLPKMPILQAILYESYDYGDAAVV